MANELEEEKPSGSTKKKLPPGVTEVELGKRGPVLPIGFSQGSVVHRAFDVRPWRMREERELAALRGDDKDSNFCQHVSMVLACLLKKVGDIDFEKLDIDDRRALISQMYMPDVFFMYIWLRVHALGPDLKIKVKLSGIADLQEFVADLNSTLVLCVDKPEDAHHKYTLKSPVNIRSKLTTEFLLGPIKWGELEKDARVLNSLTSSKAFSIAASIIGGECFENAVKMFVPLQMKELDDLTKPDIEGMVKAIDERGVGPVMKIEDKIEGQNFVAMIDWRYDSFFAASSG